MKIEMTGEEFNEVSEKFLEDEDTRVDSTDKVDITDLIID